MSLLTVLSPLVTGIAVFLLVLTGYPLLRRLSSYLSQRSTPKYQAWGQDLFLKWTPEEARRRAVYTQLAIVILPAIVLLLTRQVQFAAVAGFVAYFAPRQWYRWERERREKQFERDLPAAISVMSKTYLATSDLPRAIAEVAAKVPGPVGQEFAQIRREIMISGVRQALDRARSRLPSEGFKMMSSALILSEAYGGNLPAVLESIENATRNLGNLRQKIYVETATVRAEQKMALYLAPVFLLLGYLFDPSMVEVLFTVRGFLMMSVVAVFIAAGVLWIGRIVRSTI